MANINASIRTHMRTTNSRMPAVLAEYAPASSSAARCSIEMSGWTTDSGDCWSSLMSRPLGVAKYSEQSASTHGKRGGRGLSKVDSHGPHSNSDDVNTLCSCGCASAAMRDSFAKKFISSGMRRYGDVSICSSSSESRCDSAPWKSGNGLMYSTSSSLAISGASGCLARCALFRDLCAFPSSRLGSACDAITEGSLSVTPPPVTRRTMSASCTPPSFLMVAATPLTRSSHHAGEDFARLRAARAQRG